MRYAIFTDIHANLEALEAVLAKIDEIGQEQPVDQLWFLGDLVGYGPNPNECIIKLRERTDVIIAGNHDWAAVGKIDLEDFSAAARISAEWTAQQLTEEHREFLANLPERIEIDDCTLVHGSPYGPLWEYLTSEVLAERSFQHFNSRFCFVGHTHVPVIFQQPDTVASLPTHPLDEADDSNIANIKTTLLTDIQQNGIAADFPEDLGNLADGDDDEETVEVGVVQPPVQTSLSIAQTESAYTESQNGQVFIEDAENTTEDIPMIKPEGIEVASDDIVIEDVPHSLTDESEASSLDGAPIEQAEVLADAEVDQFASVEAILTLEGGLPLEEDQLSVSGEEQLVEEITPETTIVNAEERLNTEIEELLALLGLSQALVQVTNEMLTPPEGHWEAPEAYRAIINPGGVGQPRDGDARAAFMIYDTERGFDFYRIPYEYEKTQEKIIQAGLPQYLAIRLAYGR